MTDEQNAEMLTILRLLQVEVTAIGKRLQRLEDVARRQRRDLSGMLVLLRCRPDDYEEQVAEIESIMETLDSSEPHIN